jgi:hypothetical protein
MVFFQADSTLKLDTEVNGRLMCNRYLFYNVANFEINNITLAQYAWVSVLSSQDMGN